MFIPILDIMRKKTQGTEGRFLILEDIFESDQYASLRQLIQLQHIERDLRLVCEVRDSSALKTFRLEDAKVMSWLKRKVEVLVNNFEMVPALRNSIAYTESLPEACRSGKVLSVCTTVEMLFCSYARLLLSCVLNHLVHSFSRDLFTLAKRPSPNHH